jgi:hypothetical protein
MIKAIDAVKNNGLNIALFIYLILAVFEWVCSSKLAAAHDNHLCLFDGAFI